MRTASIPREPGMALSRAPGPIVPAVQLINVTPGIGVVRGALEKCPCSATRVETEAIERRCRGSNVGAAAVR